jgi:hypothetical protein
MTNRRAGLLGLFLLSACGEDPAPSRPDAGFEAWTLEEPEGGFQYITPELAVEAGTERQDCFFIEVPDLDGGKDMYFSRVKTAINPGSHHMNVFRVKTIKMLDGEPGDHVSNGECFKSSNWSDWPLVANSQNSESADPYTDWQLPANVAHRFSPHEKLMVQVHYVNAGTQETPFGGKAGINFYRSSDPEPVELGTMFATKQSIRICRSNPTPSFTGACNFGSDAPVNVIAANGHFHSRGKQFSMFAWDGEASEPADGSMFYQSVEWDEPLMATGLDTQIPAGGGVFWTCDFMWREPTAPTTCADVDGRDPQMAGDCCYTFGPTVENSEHCNAFVYYYPKSDDLFCL